MLNRSGSVESSKSPLRMERSFDMDSMDTRSQKDLKNLNTSGVVNEDYPLEFAKSPVPKMMNQTRNFAREGGIGFSQTLKSQSLAKTLNDLVASQSPSKGALDNSQSLLQYLIEEPEFNAEQ